MLTITPLTCTFCREKSKTKMSQSRGLDLRKQGERRTKASRPGIADAFRGPFDSLEAGAPGEVRVVGDQMTAVRPSLRIER